MYGSWDIRHSGQSFLSFRVIFCLLTDLTTQKNQNFEKRNKMPRSIIILHLCTTNHNHMMYGSCDIEQDIIFCHFGLFLHFYPLTSPKIKIIKNSKKKKKKKTPGDTIILHMRNINENHMMHGYWDMDCDRQNFCHFEPFFCPFTPLTTQKIKILNKWKKHLEISSV